MIYGLGDDDGLTTRRQQACHGPAVLRSEAANTK